MVINKLSDCWPVSHNKYKTSTTPELQSWQLSIEPSDEWRYLNWDLTGGFSAQWVPGFSASFFWDSLSVYHRFSLYLRVVNRAIHSYGKSGLDREYKDWVVDRRSIGFPSSPFWFFSSLSEKFLSQVNKVRGYKNKTSSTPELQSWKLSL